MFVINGNEAMNLFRRYVKHTQAGNRVRASVYKFILNHSKEG